MPEAAGAAPGGGGGGAAPLAWTGVSDKPSYYRLFSGYVIAVFASGIATIALALFAFDLAGEDSGAVLGTALSLKMLAYVVAAPIAAALTERIPRKPLLVGLDLARAASLATLPFVDAVWQVYALVFVFALASGTFMLVYMTVVPYLLGSEEDYAKSLARSRIASELDGAISPLLAAALLLVLAVSGVFLVATVCLLVSALLVGRASLPRTTARRPGGLWEKTFRGPRLFLDVPQFRGILALDVAVALATAMVMVNTVVIVQGQFGMEAEDAAAAFFAFGAGSVVGALVVSRILPLVSDRPVMLLGAAMIVGALLVGALVPGPVTLFLLWAVLGAGVALAFTPANYLIRRVAPPADLQTLFAAQFSIANMCLLVAYSAAGWAGAELGIPVTFVLFGIAAAAAGVAAARLWPAPSG